MLTPNRITPALSPLSAVAIALITLVVVGVLDYLTGFEISFSVFYLVPVSLAAWYAGKNWGIFLTISSSITWYAVEAVVGPAHDHLAIPAWNGVVRFVFFLVTSLLLSTLRERLAHESRMARTDGLTGLLNSRAFAEQLSHDLALNARSRGALTVVYIDLDNFKSINDRGGHGEGDRQLQRVADRMRDTLRHADSAGRLGGDEFALILPSTDREGAETFLARLARALEARDTPGGGVHCSIGALTIARGEPSADAVIGRADSLMYAAKQAGKNRLIAKDYADT
jgi:diguanylate cyclase (GGDEF)-like protein